MEQGITYHEKGSEFKTYKMKKGAVKYVLVKKDGKPFQLIRFNGISGRMLKPSELY